MTPLKIHRAHDGITLVSARGSIAKMTAGYGQTQEEDARAIIRAYNSHEAMLEALKLARRKIEMWPEGTNPEYLPEIKAIDKAISQAEQKEPRP